MAQSTYCLDQDAAELFKQLQGIDHDFGRDRLGERFRKIRKQNDRRQQLLIEFVHQLGNYLSDAGIYKDSIIEDNIIRQIHETLAGIERTEPQRRKLLIRHGGHANVSDRDPGFEYEVICGDTTVNAHFVADLSPDDEKRKKHLAGRLKQASAVLSSHGIFAVYVRMPNRGQRQKDRFDDTLRALVRFGPAVENGLPIEFTRNDGTKVVCRPVCDETGRPDVTLTLLAVANRMSAEILARIVEKVGGSSVRNRCLGLYHSIFSVEALRKRMARPPIEVNHLLWLVSDREHEAVSPEKNRLTRFAVESADGSYRNAARVLKCVYGNDYRQINSANLAGRLCVSSDFLGTVEKASANRELAKEVLGNIEPRLDSVEDRVFDELVLAETGRPDAGEPAAQPLVLHEKLAAMALFYQGRVRIKKKMRAIVRRAVDLNLQEFKILAREFDISTEEAEQLVESLKTCFDANGRFVKGSFTRMLPEYARYERKFFEFLWQYLKEYIHQKDRSSYLNALQLLIAKMQRPRAAVKILLADFCRQTGTVRYSDAKALMLCSILVRKYHKELVHMEITPEDVLLVSEGVDPSTARYAAWKIDREQKAIVEKLHYVRRRLVKAIGAAPGERTTVPLSFLFALEREAYILFALVGGATARLVLRDAAQDYADPASFFYQKDRSREADTWLMQNLRILVRGTGRIGTAEDISMLDTLERNLDGFFEPAHPDRKRGEQRILRLSACIEEARKNLRGRME